jgi:hypothetical protein
MFSCATRRSRDAAAFMSLRRRGHPRAQLIRRQWWSRSPRRRMEVGADDANGSERHVLDVS